VVAPGPRELHHRAVVEDHEHGAGDGADRAEDLGLAVEAPQPELLHPEEQRHDEGDGREDVDERGGEARRGQLRAQVVHVLVQHGPEEKKNQVNACRSVLGACRLQEQNHGWHGSRHVLEQDEPHDLEEDERRHPGPHSPAAAKPPSISNDITRKVRQLATEPPSMPLPLEEEGEGGHEEGGDEVAVDDEDEVAHAAAEGGDGDDVHPGEPHLQQHHVQVRLHLVQDLAHAHGGCLWLYH
jgi:hypothetical protein